MVIKRATLAILGRASIVLAVLVFMTLPAAPFYDLILRNDPHVPWMLKVIAWNTWALMGGGLLGILGYVAFCIIKWIFCGWGPSSGGIGGGR